jgi:hypothetical protein
MSVSSRKKKLFEYGTDDLKNEGIRIKKFTYVLVRIRVRKLPTADHLHCAVHNILLDMKKMQNVIYTFGSDGGGEISFYSATDGLLDDEVEVKLCPQVQAWLETVRDYILHTAREHVDDARCSVKNGYDKAVKMLENVLQVGVMFHLFG